MHMQHASCSLVFLHRSTLFSYLFTAPKNSHEHFPPPPESDIRWHTHARTLTHTNMWHTNIYAGGLQHRHRRIILKHTHTVGVSHLHGGFTLSCRDHLTYSGRVGIFPLMKKVWCIYGKLVCCYKSITYIEMSFNNVYTVVTVEWIKNMAWCKKKTLPIVDLDQSFLLNPGLVNVEQVDLKSTNQAFVWAAT